ncbi:MAG: tannase/feruloyl esterase family alpha/beta hydrolase, partial [Gammaproteobacteria bacterium]
MRSSRSVSLLLALITVLLGVPHTAQAANAEQCTRLLEFRLEGASISRAELVPAGSFVADGDYAVQDAGPYAGLEEFCRVAATLTPSNDSAINMEIWLPPSAWNGRFMGVGNGAFTGNVRHPAMAGPLARGYAVSSTDTGHSGNTASFGLGHPEKVADFGWRAVHEMTVASKQLLAAYYGQVADYSYWSGCSAGGRQAMVEAQKFPEDYDGIIAGAPGLDWTGRAAAALRVARHLQANPEARLQQPQRELVYDAALRACDGSDGLRDGLISQPQQCTFDPAVLACTAGTASVCLNDAQLNTVQMLYSSPLNPATGRAITGLFPGSELGWTDLGWTASARATGLEQFRYLVYADESWNIHQFEFGRDIALAESMDGNTLNALDPNLEPFFA